MNDNINESVLDPIQRTRCPAMFDISDKSDKPHIKKEMKDLIIQTVETFKKNVRIPVEVSNIYIIGSSLGFQYRDDSDIDINIKLNMNTNRFKGNFSMLPHSVPVPGTGHVLNFTALFNDTDINFDKTAENVYDVVNDIWVKQSSLKNAQNIPYGYVAGISEFLIDGITLALQRCERDLMLMQKYIALDPNKVSITEKERDEKISNKISDLIIDMDSIRLAHTVLFRLDRDGFNENPISISIQYKADALHFSMNNLVYKYIDSFKYYDKINSMVTEIKETVAVAKKEIAKDTAAKDSGEEIVKQNIVNEKPVTTVKENWLYTKDDIINALLESGYDVNEKNIDKLIAIANAKRRKK